MTLETAIITGFATLGTAIATLFAMIVKANATSEVRHAEKEARLAECERDRVEIKVKLAKLEAGCHLTECPRREKSN